MNNVILDPLPNVWVNDAGEEYPIETDFRIGIQMCMIQEDPDLNTQEKVEELVKLLFVDRIPATAQEVEECARFFLNGWFHDNESSVKENRRLIDFDVDQWRIYAAFKQQYGLDLDEAADMHFWKFMGLLSSLNECAYTRVIDIRQRKFKPKMDKEERKSLQEAKEVYELKQRRSAEEAAEEEDLFDFLGGNLKYSDQEKKRIEEFEKYADEDE